MKKFLLALMILVGVHSATFGFATIATIVKGGDQISFSSNVSDINVYLNDQLVGKTFGNYYSYKVKRDNTSKVFTFRKEGYKDNQIQLTTSLDNLFWGNIFFGHVLGSSTDSIFTNNAQEYSPNQFFIQMEKA